MPKLYPQILPEDTPRSELKVFEFLKQLPEEWTVIHSFDLKVNSGLKIRDQEVDFILSHPQEGIVVLEVKGGRVSFENGAWFSKDGEGIKHRINPVDQAKNNFYQLARYLNSRENIKRYKVSKGINDSDKVELYKATYLIWFPDTPVNPKAASQIGSHQADIFAWEDRLNIDKFMKWIKKHTVKNPKISYPLSEVYHKEFDHIFRHDNFRMIDQINSESKVITIKTSEAQRNILEIVDANDNLEMRIIGPAGSGKSLIAREIMFDCIQKNEPCYLINFSRPVTDSYFGDINIPDRYKCDTIQGFFIDLLQKSGCQPGKDPTKELHALLDKKLIQLETQCFILDEAQLMSKMEYDVLKYILDNSPSIKKKIILLDPDQSIYEWKSGGDGTHFFSDFRNHPINEIYRNTKQIATLSLSSLGSNKTRDKYRLMGPDGDVSQYLYFEGNNNERPGSFPIYIPINLFEYLLNKIGELTKREGIPLHHIGIGIDKALLPYLERLFVKEDFKFTKAGRVKKDHVTLDNWRRCAGLEREVFIYILTMKTDGKEEYSMCTRAKNRLIILDGRCIFNIGPKRINYASLQKDLITQDYFKRTDEIVNFLLQPAQ